jgi:CPA2 family monovalent cation:H+ antiporter-2
MHYPILIDLTIVMALAVAAVYLCNLIKVPSIVGFLVTGILAGPHGLGLVSASEEIEVLAEVGVVLLLFIIGMEFSFSTFKQNEKASAFGRRVAGGPDHPNGRSLGLSLEPFPWRSGFRRHAGGALQHRHCAEPAAIQKRTGRTPRPHQLGNSHFSGCIRDSHAADRPLLAGGAAGGGESGWLLLAKGVAVIAFMIVAARWLVPWVLERTVATRNRELFLITVVLICFAVAWLTASAGLSLALGAFLAGLIISESPYSHQAVSNVLPLRDLFVSVFFVSIGMLVDLGYLWDNLWLAPVVALLVIAIKTLTGGIATLALGLPFRVALASGITLAQVGEFSFVLAQTGMTHGLLPAEHYQRFINISVLTMLLTPAGVALASKLSAKLTTMPHKLPDDTHAVHDMHDHAIVVGYGINGRNVAQAARLAGIPFVVAEMNPATVRQEKAQGVPIVYGDATHEPLLEYLGAAKARVLVVVIADAAATRRVVAAAKNLNPGLYVIARTRFVQEVNRLRELGADEVIPEEYETALEIFARLLRRFMVPHDEIEGFVNDLRAESYGMLRKTGAADCAAGELSRLLSQAQVITLRVAEGSQADGSELVELELRRKHGITLLAVGRGKEVLAEPGAQTRLMAGDLVVLLGTPERLADGTGIFRV